MNETNRIAGDAAITDGGWEVKRLAAIIMDNRVALNKGWQELERLTQKLASLEQPESKVPAAKDSSSSEATDSSSVVVVKE